MDDAALSTTLLVDAVYYENGNYIEIVYNDTSKETNIVTLEILGMSDSFQKQFTESTFVEKVSLDYFPKYGWESIPVTFVVDHEEFGEIGIKTEIHSYGELKPRVIFSMG